jgi:hypothetical protein
MAAAASGHQRAAMSMGDAGRHRREAVAIQKAGDPGPQPRPCPHPLPMTTVDSVTAREIALQTIGNQAVSNP